MPSYGYIANWVQFSVATISFFCSLSTLLLIHRMRILNGYFAIIASMTVCQMTYEFNFILGVLPGYVNCILYNMLDVFGGLSFSLWSNVLSYVVLYIVVNIRSIDIAGQYKYFFMFAVFPPLALAIMVPMAMIQPSDDDDRPDPFCQYTEGDLGKFIVNTYYWGRLATIFINFVAFFAISKKVSSMMKSLAARLFNKEESQGFGRQTSQVRATAVKQCVAILVLASRMKYYPLAQALSRSGGAWDEYDNRKYSNPESTFISSVLSPAPGIFNFIIFLIMQPKAWMTVKSLFFDEEEPAKSADGRESAVVVQNPVLSNDSSSGGHRHFEYDHEVANSHSFSSNRSSIGVIGIGAAQSPQGSQIKAFDDLEENELNSVIDSESATPSISRTRSSDQPGSSFLSSYLSSVYANKGTARASTGMRTSAQDLEPL